MTQDDALEILKLGVNLCYTQTGVARVGVFWFLPETGVVK
jgi:hypothetical protein